MKDMPRVYATPPGVALTLLENIAIGTARNFVLQIGETRFIGFIVRTQTLVSGYADTCPHMQLPLAQELDGYLTQDARYIACSWHGALFDIETGLCVAGPCHGQALHKWPLEIHDGVIVTAASPH